MKKYGDYLTMTGWEATALEASLAILRIFDPCMVVLSCAITRIDSYVMVDIGYGAPRQTIRPKEEKNEEKEFPERSDIYDAHISLTHSSIPTTENPHAFQEARLSIIESFGPSVLNARFILENGTWKPDGDARSNMRTFYEKTGEYIPSRFFQRYMSLLDD